MTLILIDSETLGDSAGRGWGMTPSPMLASVGGHSISDSACGISGFFRDRFSG